MTILENKRILVVDDEPEVLDIVEELLPMCHLEKASNFDRAKQLLEEEDFDIAILDIMGVDGYKLLEIAANHNVLAVMLTAHAFSPEDIIKSYKQGAVSYVPKERLVELKSFLIDVLEESVQGKKFWSRWLRRMDDYCEKKFAIDWENAKKDEGFWEKISFT